MPRFLGYYTTLELSRDASPAEINTAYSRLITYYNPSYFSSELFEFATEKSRRIQEAYNTLHDENARKDYDSMEDCFESMCNMLDIPMTCSMRFMDACLGMMVTAALPGKNPGLASLIFLS